MGGANSRNGVNTDLVAANDTMTNTVDTEYTAHVGDETIQENTNSQTDAQVDSINFHGSVNTGGGALNVYPSQGNQQVPSITSTSTQEVTITHGKILLKFEEVNPFFTAGKLIFLFKWL